MKSPGIKDEYTVQEARIYSKPDIKAKTKVYAVFVDGFEIAWFINQFDANVFCDRCKREMHANTRFKSE
jgi:hypothetical protein